MIRNRKIKRNWNNDDITLLIWAVSKRIEANNLDNFVNLVTTILFRRKKIGNLYLN